MISYSVGNRGYWQEPVALDTMDILSIADCMNNWNRFHINKLDISNSEHRKFISNVIKRKKGGCLK